MIWYDLPYGGAVNMQGKVVWRVSKEEYETLKKRLEDIFDDDSVSQNSDWLKQYQWIHSQCEACASPGPSFSCISPSLSTIVAGPALPGLGGLDAVGGPVRPAAQARAWAFPASLTGWSHCPSPGGCAGMQAAQSGDRFFGFIQIAEVCLPYLVTVL